MNSFSFKSANSFLQRSNIFIIKRLRNFFWNLRAFDINKKWGNSTGDYETIKNIIILTNAKKILDFACGNGRLFPLFQSLGIEKVVGQDISINAINLAKRKYPNMPYILYCGEIQNLNYEENYFDLIISNRSLSAIPGKNLPEVINKLCKLGRYVYINEFGKLEKAEESFHWFKHEYESYFKNNNFKLIDKGIISGGDQEWFLYEHNF